MRTRSADGASGRPRPPATPRPGGTPPRRPPAAGALAVAVPLLAVAAILLAGCSGRAPASPAPPAPSASPHASPGSPPDPGVPAVARPIDIARLKQHPCDGLTSDQISVLLGDPVRVLPSPHGAGGPGCSWTAARPTPPGEDPASVILIVPDVDKLGLTSIYRAKGGAYPFFLPLDPIDGYPVVAYGTADVRAKGQCDVALGTSDTETVNIAVDQSAAHKGEQDPCQSARGVQETVYRNLRR
ncbi:DUF3558 domain-containing protein [Amycolatopsis sp. NPDC004079]|uniref:DUF3558 domain-containing protein n=1 Tax=Amycolatopsis sp. NPDC004079 TaxID=3154549 RepID=UPI0033B2BA71